MQPTLFRYIWRGSKKGQFVIFVLTMLALPFYYVSLELPKLIVNGVLGAVEGDFPFEVSAFDRNLLDVDRLEWLAILCFAFLLVVTVQGGLKFLLNVYKGRLGGEQLLTLRREICARILHLPHEAFEQMSSDEMSTMIGAELSEVGGFIGEAFATPLLQGGLLITAIVFIFVQDAWLGLAAIALFPVQGYVIPKLQKRVNSLNRDRIAAMRSLASRLRETTDALPEIQAAGDSKVELNALEKCLVEIYNIRYAIFWRRSFIKLLNSFLFQLTPFLFLLIGGWFVLEGDLTLGALVAVLAAYKDLPPPARELLDYYQSLKNVQVQYEQVVARFEPPGYDAWTNNDSMNGSRRDGRSDIEVDAVRLSGKEGSTLVEDVSFSIGQGESVAVVGLSGFAGRELARALVGVTRPSHGNIRVGGITVTGLTLSDRHGILLIGGRGTLFNGTLRENLHYGQADPNISSERDFESLKAVQMIEDLSHLGLNAVLDSTAQEQIAAQILNARHMVRSRLGSEGLIEPFDADALCLHISIIDNIVWGKPVGSGTRLDELTEHPATRKALRRAGLEQPLLALGIAIGRDVASNGVDQLSADDPVNDLVFSDERATVIAAVAKADSDVPARLSKSERRLLTSIAMRIVPAWHTRYRISGDLGNRVLTARRYFSGALTSTERGRFEFFDPDRYARGLTIRENLLFGVVRGAQRQSVTRLETTLLELIDEYDLADTIMRAGFEYSVGLHGNRLTPEQRQKVELARIVNRDPDLTVLHGATSDINEQDESAIVSALVAARRGSSLFWILDRPSLARHFESVLVFERGRLVERGRYPELERAGTSLHALLASRTVA